MRPLPLGEAPPLQPAKLSVFVFQDDFPLNGEQDGGGGIDILSPNEAGLGSFQITLFDDAGGPGDATGQPTYDMFNMPLSNSLAGQIDPATGNDACPISPRSRTGIDTTTGAPGGVSPTGITGMIVTCPKYESDGKTLSPLAGQAIVANLYPGRYGVCGGTDPTVTGTNCHNTLTGTVTTNRMSRTPDQRLYSSGDNSSFAFTQCYVSFGDPYGEDFAFAKCAADGSFTLSG